MCEAQRPFLTSQAAAYTPLITDHKQVQGRSAEPGPGKENHPSVPQNCENQYRVIALSHWVLGRVLLSSSFTVMGS